MNFGNNIEAMGFEKSGWSIIETSADGSTIYMGKPKFEGADTRENVWYIRRITTETDGQGKEIVTIMNAANSGSISWARRETTEYSF